MAGGLLLLTILAPLALLLVFVAVREGEGLRWTLPLASLPALLLALQPEAALVAP